MNQEKSQFIVSADWVEKNLGAPEFRIVDASWYLPAQNRNGADEYASGHIPGAVFFDQDAIADHSTGLPHTIPSPDLFSETVGKLGIAETDTIVIYDGPGIFTAPRVWWLFRTMGAEKVFVMDGGIDGWKRENRPISTDLPEPRPVEFKASFQLRNVTPLAEMKKVVAGKDKQIADARSPGRFTAKDPEPRAGLRGGHMPGARNMPIGLFSENGKFKPLAEIRQAFADAGIDLERPVVTSCGSGVTAAVISLALASVGHNDHSLYDGSWSEWGGLEDVAVVTGEK